jgi:alpha-tubulin suppressor-like RCC1 family protein
MPSVGATISSASCDGSTTNTTSPVLVSAGFAWQQVQSDLYSTCALTTAGKAYCWGRNINGDLGDGTTTNRLLPTAVATGTPFAALGVGHDFGQCAVAKSGGAPWGWGLNGSGQLGTGSTATAVTTPYKVLNP